MKKKLILNKEALKNIADEKSAVVVGGYAVTQPFTRCHYAVSGCVPCWA